MPAIRLEIIDRPELTWTFADSVPFAMLESRAICRIEFCTIQWSNLQPTAAASGKQYPVCRIAMPLKAMIELHKRFSNLLSQLEQEGTPERTELSSSLKSIN